MTGLFMKYFVLKPKGGGRYAKASRAAMHTYAKFIKKANPVFAEEIINWASTEGAEAYAKEMESRS